MIAPCKIRFLFRYHSATLGGSGMKVAEAGAEHLNIGSPRFSRKGKRAPDLRCLAIAGGGVDAKLVEEYTGKRTTSVGYRAVIAPAKRQLREITESGGP